MEYTKDMLHIPKLCADEWGIIYLATRAVFLQTKIWIPPTTIKIYMCIVYNPYWQAVLEFYCFIPSATSSHAESSVT